MRRSALLILIGAVHLSACADNPSAPPEPAADPARQVAAVGVVGILTERNGSTLVLVQRAFDLEPATAANVRSARYEPAIGRVGDPISIVVDASTQFYLNGERVSSLDGIPLQARLVVAGAPDRSGIRAAIVSDLASVRSATQAHAPPKSTAASDVRLASTDPPTGQQVSLCIGQNMDYADPKIHEFHGCWLGPTVSDRIALPDIPLSCGLIGCFFVDEISYTAALGGWVFDWPFRFEATSPGLTYHVPSPVTFKLAALPASGTAFTFAGGLGIDLGVDLELCNIFGCFDLGTQHFSLFTTAHQTTGAGPLRPDHTLDINEVACPFSFGLIPADIPLNPVSFLVCEDLVLIGEPFETSVQAAGASGQIGRIGSIFDFDGADDTRSIRPDATSVVVTYREFNWVPRMQAGISFAIEILGGTRLWESPPIPIYTGPFAAITTPYPNTFGFTEATDPENLAQRLHQPTLATVATFQVAPAPTTLRIISPPVLEQGMPVRAQLTESFDGSRIANAQLRFTATSASGTLVLLGTTDVLGIAEAVLPNGEHDVLVEYAGSEVYLPSSATQHVFVYLPTQFVIWGGNAGGVTLGSRYQFWGAQWHRQVTGGDFTANASFKGYAETVVGDEWMAGGGNSSGPPDEIAGLISVIISTAITKQGDVIKGNVARHVLLRVENPERYRPNPGHAGFGIMSGEVPRPPDEEVVSP